MCTWVTAADATSSGNANDYETFAAYKDTLRLDCESDGEAARLTVTPDDTWPAQVYYQVRAAAAAAAMLDVVRV